MDRQKAMVGAAVTLVAVLVVGVVYVIVRSPALTCELVKFRPSYDPKSVKDIASADYKDLAHFSGHLIYEFESSQNKSEIFMPLGLDSIEHKLGKDQVSNLVMSTNCSSIDITLSTEKNVTTVSKIEVDLAVSNGHESRCLIKDLNLKLFNVHGAIHYECNVSKLYTCISVDPNSKNKVLARLVIDDIEFELNGDEAKHKEGKYDTKPIKCT